MKLSMQELGCIFYTMNSTPENEPRRFQFTEMSTIAELSKKLSAVIEDDRIPPGEHEVSLTTSEKTLIKGHMEEMTWSMGDAETVSGLVEKLDK